MSEKSGTFDMRRSIKNTGHRRACNTTAALTNQLPSTQESIMATAKGTRVLAPSQAPKRIQRRRTKGWRMPEGAVYVGRPTKWGNPFVVGEWDEVSKQRLEAGQCVRLFRTYITQTAWPELVEHAIQELRGRDLACWCPLDQPCHADVLLELANA
jgi:hypothetical protein